MINEIKIICADKEKGDIERRFFIYKDEDNHIYGISMEKDSNTNDILFGYETSNRTLNFTITTNGKLYYYKLDIDFCDSFYFRSCCIYYGTYNEIDIHNKESYPCGHTKVTINPIEYDPYLAENSIIKQYKLTVDSLDDKQKSILELLKAHSTDLECLSINIKTKEDFETAKKLFKVKQKTE